VDPVLGREVVDRQQLLDVVGDLRDRLRELRPVGGLERLHGVEGVPAVLGVPNLREGLLRPGMRRLRQRAKYVSDLVEPAALLAGRGEHLAQRAPEPECAVADREHRGPHPAPGAVTQQVRPGLGGLPVAIAQGDQLLTPVRAHPDQHEQAQFVLFKADVDVDAVRPQVDEVHSGQIAGGEGALLGLPRLGQLRDHRRRQPGRGAEELAQGRGEVPGREPMQVQQRQYLGDLRGLAAPGGQDRRAEPLTFAGVGVGAAVVDPWCGHLDRAGAGEDFARLVAAVTHDQAVAVLVELGGEPRDVGVDLGLQGFGEHPPGAIADNLVDQRRRAIRRAGVIGVSNSRNYGKHGSYLPDRRWRADLA